MERGKNMKVDSKALNAIMAEKGLSGEELARLSGLSTTTISLIRCRTTARHKTVGKIANALGVPSERILA
jgi:transcriptional regulator with XRE-family HTH domain